MTTPVKNHSSPQFSSPESPVKAPPPRGRLADKAVVPAKRKLDFGNEPKELAPKKFKFTGDVEVTVYEY